MCKPNDKHTDDIHYVGQLDIGNRLDLLNADLMNHVH